MSPQDRAAEVGRIVGECAGAVSMCWEPRPEGVFDSSPAAKYVDEAVAEILRLYEITE